MPNLQNVEKLITALIDNKDNHDNHDWAVRPHHETTSWGATPASGPESELMDEHFCGGGTVCAAGMASLLAGYQPLFVGGSTDTGMCVKRGTPKERWIDERVSISDVAAEWLGLPLDIEAKWVQFMEITNEARTHDEVIHLLKDVMNDA